MNVFAQFGDPQGHEADPQHAEPAGGEHQEGAGEHTGTVEHGAGHEAGHLPHYTLEKYGFLVYVVAVAGLILLLMGAAKKGLNNRVFKKPITSKFEQLFLFLENLATGIIGPHGRKYLPMLMVFWTMIFVSNLVALFFPAAPTADLSFNLGLAIIAIMYVQWEGMRSNGVIGHFKHFAGPSMGWGLIIINLMLFVIELVSESMKMVSLSLRLYGNIDGGHKAADAMSDLFSKTPGDMFVPIGALLLPIKLLTCVVQALIFCLLFCVYLSLVTHHEEHHEGHASEGHGEPAHAH